MISFTLCFCLTFVVCYSQSIYLTYDIYNKTRGCCSGEKGIPTQYCPGYCYSNGDLWYFEGTTYVLECGCSYLQTGQYIPYTNNSALCTYALRFTNGLYICEGVLGGCFAYTVTWDTNSACTPPPPLTTTTTSTTSTSSTGSIASTSTSGSCQQGDVVNTASNCPHCVPSCTSDFTGTWYWAPALSSEASTVCSCVPDGLIQITSDPCGSQLQVPY